MLEPQRDGESAFQYMSRLEAEFKRVKLMIQAVRGGSFKGRKPNGDWWVIFKGSGEEKHIQDAAPVELVLKCAGLRCSGCGCPTEIHSQRQLAEEELRGKRNKEKKRCGGEKLDGTKCGCSRAPEEIRALQCNADWIAKRLAARMMEREMPGWREVTGATLYRGVREAPAHGDRASR